MKAVSLFALTLLLPAGAVLAQPAVGWLPGADGSVPAGAFAAGSENGRPLFLCRAAHDGGVHPGKLVGRHCNIGYGGTEVTVPRYEVLVGVTEHRWSEIPVGSLTSVGFAGGEERGQPLWVCRVSHRGGVHPGKVVAGRCNVGFGGREEVFERYEVLSLVPERRGTVVEAPPPGAIPPQRPVPVHPPRVDHAPPRFEAVWLAGSPGALPLGAFAGGSEGGRETYVCRGFDGARWLPGKLVEGTCRIGWGGRELRTARWEVLSRVGAHRWIPGGPGPVAPGAVVGTVDGDREVHVCRGVIEGGYHSGRLFEGTCRVAWNGGEVSVAVHELLVLFGS